MMQKIKFLQASVLFGFSYAVLLQEREVPQEHSHERILVAQRKLLAISNPLEILDPVYGLLGDKAASQGAGKVTNLKCLQRKTADQGFTNAKNAKDIEGMTNALIYATLERNTGAVGKASDTCDEPATNPEINALKQHQDPASPGADKENKELVLELARQIESIGGKPEDAALSATFAPGKLGDPTAKGNSCDDQDDPEGCIYTKKLIQVEATPEEIKAAIKTGGSSSESSTSSVSSADSKVNKKVNKKVVEKRHQVTKNPQTATKEALNSNKFPKIIPRDNDGPNIENDDKNDNDKVKRDDDDNNNRGRRGNRRNRGNRRKGRKGRKGRNRGNDNDDKRKRDFDGPDFENDNDNDNNNNNDNDKVKRDDDDNNNNNDNDKVKRVTAQKRNVMSKIKISEKKNHVASSGTKKDGPKVKRASESGKNVQTFTGTKGGPPPEVIETLGSTRPYNVKGDTFVGKNVALRRSCDIQHNACANAANAANSGGGGSVAECEDQQKKCIEAASALTKRFVERRSILSFFTKRAPVDLGTCSDPTVEFKEGFDGRKDASFKAVNQKDFNHGSTQKLKITSDFICQRLESSCKASQQVIDNCKKASEAASSLSGQAAADVFNKAFA
ncbi:hypothetical protein OnM2_043073 [Erysiphe neolycopersici]|uniref:Uncharacterized protein n=1 Tax=Erysiphe neolycopersici TaxID=212602 RepID=A0A420HV93_9PEZI|nr:hypothetical protein OnM2_043073 [Erysiphe neolycopersici]